ncbi:hypothetical protein G5V59_09005 [Nocardioides sp. W3-2-3]|uniref:hypothetical protein n=1 Tax=Nocardioides convexus TaxID=2712224 RepID=UPI00241849BD|nr:hypothetical protein [Nocardioides convexus]NHA00224.1 hypothetical protein [Nocardioides convexus]
MLGADIGRFEQRFGEDSGRVAFVNSQGLEISLDKSGRFSPTFGGRTPEQTRAVAGRHGQRHRDARRARRPGVPGVRHPARRGPRGRLPRPRLRRRPRLRLAPPHAGGRDHRVLPAAARGQRARLRDLPLQRRRLPDRRAGGRRLGPRPGPVRRLSRLRAALPDGRGRHRLRGEPGSTRSRPARSPGASTPHRRGRRSSSRRCTARRGRSRTRRSSSRRPARPPSASTTGSAG